MNGQDNDSKNSFGIMLYRYISVRNWFSTADKPLEEHIRRELNGQKLLDLFTLRGLVVSKRKKHYIGCLANNTILKIVLRMYCKLIYRSKV